MDETKKAVLTKIKAIFDPEGDTHIDEVEGELLVSAPVGDDDYQEFVVRVEML